MLIHTKSNLRQITINDAIIHRPLASADHWNHNVEFRLALFICMFSFKGMLDIAALCLEYGGCSFMIAYGIVSVLIVVPILLIEISLGQFTGKYITKSWLIVSGFVGISYSNLLLCCLTIFQILSFIKQFTVYFYFSLQVYPNWVHCNNTYNTPSCVTLNKALTIVNVTASQLSSSEFYDLYMRKNLISPNKTLFSSNFFENINLTDTLAAVFIFIALILSEFSKMSFLNHCPLTLCICLLFLLIILLMSSVTLENSGVGLKYFAYFKLSQLLHPYLWVNAVKQSVITHYIGIGLVMTLSKFNSYRSGIETNLLLIIVWQYTTYLVGTFISFQFLGFYSTHIKYQIEEVYQSNPFFGSLTTGLFQFSYSNFYLICFFLIVGFIFYYQLICLIEVVNGAIIEKLQTKWTFKAWHLLIIRISIVTIIILIEFFIFNRTSILFSETFLHISIYSSYMLIAFFEIIIIAYIFGMPRFNNMYYTMTKKNIPIWICLSMLTICPFMLLSGAIVLLTGNGFPRLLLLSEQNKSVKVEKTVGWITCSVILLPILLSLTISLGQRLFLNRNQRNENIGINIKESVYDCFEPDPQFMRRHLSKEAFENLDVEVHKS